MSGEKKRALVERLFSEHRAALQAFFRRRIRVLPDAPDLAQEVYIRMLGVRDVEAIRNPELYLFTVANNLLKEQALISRRRSACDDIDDVAVQEQLVDLPQFEGEFDAEVRARRLREVLTELSPKCRATVVLQYRFEMGHADIAARLGISTHMVKKYLSQALRHCRVRMQRLR